MLEEYVYKMILKTNLIFNIDKASGSKNIKTHYAWLLKGWPRIIKNERIKGSLCFISIISTNKYVFNYVTKGTIKSSKFIKNLDHFKTYVIQWMKTDMNKVLMMLDNWSLHQLEDMKKQFEKVGGGIHIYTSIFTRVGTHWILF